MKSIPVKHDIEDLDETVLEAEAEMNGESAIPEIASGTDDDAVWDVSPEDPTQRVPIMSLESDETITEQMVNAGIEEADLEQREAADDLEP